MVNNELTRLGPTHFGEAVADVETALHSAERLLPVTGRYRDLLTAFGGAVLFEQGAKFTTDERCPLSDKGGYNNLEMLYGLGNGEHSIEYHAARYEGEVPASFVPIGEAPGGNLVCVDKSTGSVHLWDHESLRGEVGWRIANSLDEFFDRLQPDDSGIGNTDGIIESESFLDF